ncbi:MAG TPA: carboxypeptidase regulatory-like domain-containing protein, partial [Candidatus Syntrophosphaera sp.]|nr:carboxypeptidase regulatory-like domain-containing protein [Candidatus Syntrophosphaera sp.]
LQKGWAAAQQKYAFLDGSKACALGASYGGYMTNWIAGNWFNADGSAPFKCLVTHNGVFDNRSMGLVTEELWFGFLCDVTGVNPAYAGVDAGPAVNGFGNMIHWQGSWTTLLAVNSYCDFNWNIQGYLGFGPPPAPELTPLCPGRVKSVSLSAASGSPTREPERIVAYKVWRFLQGQANNEAAWTMLTPNTIFETTFEDPGWYALPDGIYYWAVKAIYLNGVQSEPAFSNPLTKVTQVGTVAGVVRNAQNIPIAGAVVASGNHSATTNSIGAYTLLLPAGTYDFSCSATGYATQTAAGIVVVTNQTTTLNFVLDSVDIDESLSPVFETALLGNFPNPFNPETAIRFSLRESGSVWIGVYNLKGQLVTTLVDDIKEAGAHSVSWAGRDAHGRPVSSGVYILSMRSGAYSGWHRILMLK